MSTAFPRQLLHPHQAAELIGLSKSTLAKMRMEPGKGPKFIKTTRKSVAYDPADIEAWVDERRRASTLTARR